MSLASAITGLPYVGKTTLFNLLTEAHATTGAYVRALRDLDPFVDVMQQACPKLVPLVEAGKAKTGEAIAAVREYVRPLLTEGGVVAPVVDTLLLGCTHYPLLKDTFAAVAGPNVRVVDSATTTALAVREVLTSHRLVREGEGAAHRVYATGPAERFRAVASAIFGHDLPEVEEAALP